MAEKRDWLSGYNYVQNNPLNRIDPDGAFDTKAEAKQYAEDNNIKTGFLRNNKIQKADDGSYAINNKKESTSISNDKDMGVTTGALVVGDRMPQSPDAMVVSIGFDFAFLGGAGYSFQAVAIKEGEDQGIHYYNTTNANIGFGVSAGVTVSAVDFNEKNSKGDKLTSKTFEGNGNNFTAGVGAYSAAYGFSTTDGRHTLNPAAEEKLYTVKSVGVGVGGDVGVMWQGTSTKKTNKK